MLNTAGNVRLQGRRIVITGALCHSGEEISRAAIGDTSWQRLLEDT